MNASAERQAKIARFASLLQSAREADTKRRFPHSTPEPVRVHYGKKYVRVDVGGSGAYMVDGDKIFGIKAYGVIHRGHYYGTLDEIEGWNWGPYYAVPASSTTATATDAKFNRSTGNSSLYA